MRIAVVNPNGGGGYGGPGVFADRLFGSLAVDHEITLVHDRRRGATADSAWAAGRVTVMTFRDYSPREQLRWSALCAWWLLRHSGDYDLVHIHGAA